MHGASEEGYDFYRQVISTGYCEIVLWTDRQYEWWRRLNLPVDPPERIKDMEYDLIVLTAEKKNVEESMRRDLLKMGVDDNRIYWKEDCLIKGNVAAGYDADRIRAESNEAVQDDPVKYLNEGSLDIVVRVLYAKDIIDGLHDARHEKMYRRLMMSQNNGSEPTDSMISAYFTEYSQKSGWEAFDLGFRGLIDSMKTEGFRKESFIPIDRHGRMINGRHRLAAAVALNLPVWVRKYEYDGIKLCFDRKWLEDVGFSDDEISEVIEAYHRFATR